MMKTKLASLSLLVAIISTNAFAAPPVANIQVTGAIKPPTCTVNGAEQNNVIFDFGKISPTIIPQTKNYEYQAATVKKNITITCDAETYLTFKTTDTYDNGQLSSSD